MKEESALSKALRGKNNKFLIYLLAFGAVGIVWHLCLIISNWNVIPAW